MALNNVNLEGRLVKDIELKYTPSGTAVANFTLAVARDYKDEQTGERPADFLNCVVWRGRAETMANHLRKGDRIIVSARAESRNFEGQDGKTVWVTEFNVQEFYFVETLKRDDQTQPEDLSRYSNPSNNNGGGNNRNQNNNRGNANPFRNTGGNNNNRR